MIPEKELSEKLHILNDFSMEYETGVSMFSGKDYLKEFYDFYEIKNRKAKLIPSSYGFKETLKETGGDDCCMPICGKTQSLFGMPKRVLVFDDDRDVREEMEGPEGLSPFFFVFGLMFCEFKDYTLCFISGSNN